MLAALRACLTSSFAPFGRSGRVTHADVSMLHVSMMHISVMHLSLILIVVSMMHVSMMYVSMMHVSVMHVSMMPPRKDGGNYQDLGRLANKLHMRKNIIEKK